MTAGDFRAPWQEQTAAIPDLALCDRDRFIILVQGGKEHRAAMNALYRAIDSFPDPDSCMVGYCFSNAKPESNEATARKEDFLPGFWLGCTLRMLNWLAPIRHFVYRQAVITLGRESADWLENAEDVSEIPLLMVDDLPQWSALLDTCSTLLSRLGLQVYATFHAVAQPKDLAGIRVLLRFWAMENGRLPCIYPRIFISRDVWVLRRKTLLSFHGGEELYRNMLDWHIGQEAK